MSILLIGLYGFGLMVYSSFFLFSYTMYHSRLFRRIPKHWFFVSLEFLRRFVFVKFLGRETDGETTSGSQRMEKL